MIHDRLIGMVGAKNTVVPADSDRFAGYLKDETFLQGTAALVLLPENKQQLLAVLSELHALRREFPKEAANLTLTLRGGGSGLSGACVPDGGIVLDLTRMNQVLDIDEKNMLIRAECGIILSQLNQALADSPLFYAVDPSSLALCTLGGSIATNAAGPSSLKYGTTRQNLAALRFASAQGQIIAAGALPAKTSMGFSLVDLLCGSEGRLGIVLDADVRLRMRPEETALVVGCFATEQAAVDFILEMRRHGIKPKCIEILDDYSRELANFPVRGGAVLMIEFDGIKSAVDANLEKLLEMHGAAEWVSARDEKSRQNLWSLRRSITHELRKLYAFKLGEDIAVPLTALAAITAFARQKAAERGVKTAIWGHAGDGNLHVNYLLEAADSLPVLDVLMQELAVEVIRVGGAISGEHGLGRLKRKLARLAFPAPRLDMERSIKAAFDPDHILNPALERA
jgi:FAD/FMN-containing dehydrogenase